MIPKKSGKITEYGKDEEINFSLEFPKGMRFNLKFILGKLILDF